MRTLTCLAAAALLAAPMAVPAKAVDPGARLDKALEGRLAGRPVNCIPMRQIQSTEIFEKTAILYKVGRTWYLNRPTSGLNFLRRDSVLVTNTHSSVLCSVDIVRLLDDGARFPAGSLGLGPFIPYTKGRG